MANTITKIDYKEADTLKRFLNPHGRVLPRGKTGLSMKDQKKVAEAVKRARFMGLLPFVVR